MIARKQKPVEETIMILTPNSSVKSSITVDSDPSETRDSSYFPGCRKDANCNCEICIASINATLDLMPPSMHRSSLTRFSASRPVISRSPVPFGPSSADLSTPKPSGRARTPAVSPPPGSIERTGFEEKVEREKRELGYGVLMRVFWVLILVLGVEYGFSWLVSGVLKPRLSPGIVKNLGEKSRDFESLGRRFHFLKNELEELVGKEVSSCSSVDSSWRISQDGLLLHSRCVLYKSMIEEVSIWGWPLQAAGLLETEFSSRSFSIISGQVAEWSNAEAKYLIRKATNSSWEQGKWTASVVQLDPNTWILEYRRSFLIDNPKLVSAAGEVLKFRLTRQIEKMKQEFWLLSMFGRQDIDYTERSMPIPT
ncbi:hypothetical protein Salat_0566200 [Sesamum alatum]|uniref:Uncharacterized protein n=1 Tax=Sesamum alatum TaxID=300844 RepID=A0AAE1YPK5_9LAMI|nr:hypothetical protein Salat_0566200 [Sesamum alatum]